MGEKKKKGSISYAKWGYIFIAPFFIIFAVFQLIPLVSTIYYSFFEYYRSGLKIIGPTFVGLKNYITLFATDLPKYFGNTLLLWIIGFIPQIAISLLLAAWFTDLRLKLKGQTFFKTVIYMPNLIMASAFAMLFFALFSDNGPVNSVLLSMVQAGLGVFISTDHPQMYSPDTVLVPLRQDRYRRYVYMVTRPGLAASTAAAQLIRYNQQRAVPEQGRQPRADGGDKQ